MDNLAIIKMEDESPLNVGIRKSLGRKVRRYRTECGMTLQDLADRCGVFRTYLSRIESGNANPTIAVLAALALILNVSIVELFED